jgi:hypothetical protein
MKNTFFLSLILIGFMSCNFSKSVKKDLISGLTTTGNILTCDDVFITVDDVRITRDSFTYGEKLYVHYNDIRGFTKVNGNVFPDMKLVVTDKLGDTMLYSDNLYSKYTEGMNYTPLELTADLTIAAPIKSNGEYILHVLISDKKGSGTYSSKIKFTVKPNDLIKIEPVNISYDEVYLFSPGFDKVITDGKIKFDDNIYIIIEGIKGFKEENGNVFPGLKLTGVDNENNTILNYDDLLNEYSETGVAASDLATRVSAHFKITGTDFKNPLHCEMTVWDKKSAAKLIVSSDLILQK